MPHQQTEHRLAHRNGRGPRSPAVTRSVADAIAGELTARQFGPFLATPCGVLAPLLDAFGPNLITVSREETAVGVAAGAALAGRRPVVLMQNSGFGASVNALASLIKPYAIPILLVVSLRGVTPDATTENLAMGTMTVPILDLLGIAHRTLDPDRYGDQVAWASAELSTRRRPAALLVPPTTFGWTPA
jgi:sulfopyruvate decarboxylase subunit alpha